MQCTSINNLSHLANLPILIIFSLTFSRYEDYIFSECNAIVSTLKF